ncbi:NG,NG-dimethylarginine dimethylaminohydrolase 1 (EC [Olavius sp. associated proteobacterium Delta 1]|nr:NG,NG-dimethylarginine dimethylaminohydrolase 1 (EC [Olavius sp. associated proteobacterium Delta 1]
MSKMNAFEATYGGEGWSPRTRNMNQEIGTLWGACGIDSEWAPLKKVLLHSPGKELMASLDDYDAAQMLEPLDVPKARAQHEDMAAAFKKSGIEVFYIEPDEPATPNQMFVADLMAATPEGVIIARPASTVRAGEERWAARRLADMGVPIVKSIRGNGTFEGADAMWLRPDVAIIGRGLRTNDEGAAQVASILKEMGVEVVQVDQPFGSMHLMGSLRFADQDLGLAYPNRLAHRAVEALKRCGIAVAFVPRTDELRSGSPFNFVCLGPREILMPAGNPQTQAYYESLGINCHTVDVSELRKAAGAIGCLTGIVERELV